MNRLQPKHIHFCLNNTAVIRRLLGHPSNNCQEVFLKFYEAQTQLQPTHCFIHWSPGHVDIAGNEAANKEAGLGSLAKLTLEKDREVNGQLPTFTHVRRINRR